MFLHAYHLSSRIASERVLTGHQNRPLFLRPGRSGVDHGALRLYRKCGDGPAGDDGRLIGTIDKILVADFSPLDKRILSFIMQHSNSPFEKELAEKLRASVSDQDNPILVRGSLK